MLPARSLFGTTAFALFCFYLMCCVIKGNVKLGLNFVFVTIHPMKIGATLMSSFLFNVALVDLCSIAVIQFCATAFDGCDPPRLPSDRRAASASRGCGDSGCLGVYI